MTSNAHSYINKFEKKSRLGQGGFGEVYSVLEKDTGNLYAAKISLKEVNENTSSAIISLSREVNINAQLDHPSILKFIGFSPVNFENEPKPVIISELSKNGSLKRIIDLERMNCAINGWDDTKKLINIYGIASGMMYLHLNKIVHRDLKPENILLDDFLFPKIADFGLSKVNHENKESVTAASTTGIKGTPIYIAPEVWRTEKSSEAGDVYAFAFIVYEILTTEKPLKEFRSYFDIMQKVVMENYRPSLDYPIENSYKELIEACWSQNPIDRPTFSEIVDKLRNNKSFITENVDEGDFLNYVDYIDTYQAKFDSTKRVINITDLLNLNSKSFQLVKVDQQLLKIIEKDDFESPLLSKIREEELFPNDEFENLDENCQKMVKEAQNNPEKQFFVGKKIFEGEENFVQNTEIGIRYLKKAIAGGSIESSIYYSRLLIEGKMVPRDFEKAKKYLTKYFDKKNPNIDVLYGIICEKEKNYQEAKQLFEKASKAGNVEAMFEYGKMLYKGEGVEKNEKEAAKFFEMAKRNGCQKVDIFLEKINNPVKAEADNGDVIAMKKYAMMLDEGNGVKINKTEAIKYFKMAADSGDVDSMFTLGLKYDKGEGIEQNDEEAFNYIKKAAIGGNLQAMYEYALRLDDGTLANEIEACKFYKNAADNDIVPAMYKYAFKLDTGNGVAKNRKEAFKYYKMASKKGHVESMMNCAIMLSIGDGITIDQKEGSEYFKMAAKKGNEFAMNRYAWMLLRGEGIDKNLSKACKYFKMSAAKGSKTGFTHYGMMLYEGEGIEQNIEESIKCLEEVLDYKWNRNSTILKHLFKAYFKKIEVINEDKEYYQNQGNIYLEIAAYYRNVSCMNEYGQRLFKGENIDQNREEGIEFILRAINYGYKPAMKFYGEILLRGDGIEQNEMLGRKYLEMAKNIKEGDYLTLHKLSIFKQMYTAFDTEKSVKHIHKIINSDNKDYLYYYAYMLETGSGVIADQKEASKYYKMAADLGNVDAMIKHGFNLYNGIGIKENKAESARYYRLAADNGNIEAMIYYAIVLKEGDGIPLNREESLKYFKMAADKGSSSAMNQYAWMMLNGEKTENSKEEACKYFKMSADKGNIFGIMLYEEYSAESSREDSIKYLKKCVDTGNYAAMGHYGRVLFNNGDKELAISYFKIAADEGNNSCQVIYSLFLYFGDFIEQNIKLSFKYLIKADTDIKCNFIMQKFDHSDLYQVGFKYLHGIGVPINKEIAIKYYQLALNCGNLNAKFDFALMLLLNEKHLEEDIKKANEYFEQIIKSKNTFFINKIAWLLNSGEIKLTKYTDEDLFLMSAELDDTEALLKYGYEISSPVSLESIKRAADKGHITAMFRYAFYKNDDFPIYLKMAAEKNHRDALYQYGLLLNEGYKDIIKCDRKEALKYIKKAADQGCFKAMNFYANAIESTNRKEAFQYHYMASLSNNSDSINVLIKMICNGYKCDLSDTEVNRLCIVAIENKNVMAMNKYAFNLFNGIGTVKNEWEAIQYYKMAIDEGDVLSMNDYASILYSQDKKKEAARFFKMAAEKGNLNSMNEIGKMLFKGDGISSDKEKAARYFKAASEQGFVESMYNYGVVLEHGIGCKSDTKLAVEMYKKAADNGNLNAMFNYAVMLSNGSGTDQNKEEACHFYKMAADKGHIKSMLNYAVMLEHGFGTLKNLNESSRYYKMAADLGLVEAMNNYGLLAEKESKIEEAVYYFKMATDKGSTFSMLNYARHLSDPQKVAHYYKLAADKGNEIAMYNFALALLNGFGVPVDKNEAIRYLKLSIDKKNSKAMCKYASILIESSPEEAVEYFKMAADMGDDVAILNLAVLWSNGIGLLADRKEGCRLYKMAADMGNVDAMFNYAVMLEGGCGVEEDLAEACKYYKMAANKNHLKAMNNLAILLEKGVGAGVDVDEARRYYKMAADQGDKYAINNLNFI